MSAPEHVFEPITSAAFARLMEPFAPHGGRVAVAVSGGADSLALALLLAEWGGARGVHVSALTVDHGLRENSTAEARTVGGWLAEWGIEQHILTWGDGPQTRAGLQSKARDARYGLMAAWCRAHGVGRLFVAHHQGDQAETFVMRLKRASTLFGLKAMAPTREVAGMVVCRPLLGVAKADLEATLRARGQAWVDDPSNANRAFERVRTRALIAALADEGVTPARLAGAARAAACITDIVDRAADAFEAVAVRARETGLEIDAQAFSDLPPVVRERVLSRLLGRIGGRTYAPSPAKVERLGAWMAAWTAGACAEGGAARTLGQCIVRHCEDQREDRQGEKTFSIVPEGPRKPFRQAKKAGFFAPAPLPRTAKRPTSQATGGVYAHTKC